MQRNHFFKAGEELELLLEHLCPHAYLIIPVMSQQHAAVGSSSQPRKTTPAALAGSVGRKAPTTPARKPAGGPARGRVVATSKGWMGMMRCCVYVPTSLWGTNIAGPVVQLDS